jgi:hypothetical protein
MPPLTLLAFLVILTTWHPDQRRPNLLVVVECRAPWPIRPGRWRRFESGRGYVYGLPEIRLY